ncbi:MAG: AAA family ATPase [Desulfobulbaceae bacterium]|jgi:pilus assembly protein CpaE|nr:AAA family ATPase [Desulfobulbaceae bacterium]
MDRAHETLTGSRKKALYIGNNGELFAEVEKNLSLSYDLIHEEISSSRWSGNADLVLIEAIGIDTEQAIATIPGVRDIVGDVPVFMIIDKRDGDALLRASRLGAQGFIEAPDDLPDILSILQRGQRYSQGSYSGEISTFFSLKGGVGCTTIAVNVAQHLALKSGGSTVLVDLNMPLGDTSLYIEHDNKESYSLNDFILNINRLDEGLLKNALARHASGLSYLGLPPKLEELESITDANIKMVFSVLKRYFNHIIVDCASDLSPVTIACLDSSDHIFLVAEPSLSSMRAIRVANDTCLQLGYPDTRQKLILNRKTSTNSAVMDDLLSALNVPVAAEINNDYITCLEALQQGQLLNDFAPDSIANAQLKAIATYLLQDDRGADHISTIQQEEKTGWFSNLFAGRTPLTAGGK